MSVWLYPHWQPAPSAAPSSALTAARSTAPQPAASGAYRRRQRDTAGGQSIDSLISALQRITGELEKHTSEMNYTGTDEFDVHTFSRHPFDDSAYDVLQDLTQRIDRVGNDLFSAEDERQNYAALTPQQQESRTAEFEEMAHEAQASAEQQASGSEGLRLGRRRGRRCRRRLPPPAAATTPLRAARSAVALSKP